MGFHVIWFLKQTMQLLFISAREFLSFFFILLPPFRFRLLSFKCLQCWKNFSLSLRGNFWLVPRWRAEVWRHLKGLRIWRKGSIWKLQMKFCLLCGTSFVIYLPSLCFFFSALPKVKLRLLLTHLIFLWFPTIQTEKSQSDSLPITRNCRPQRAISHG